MTDSMAGVKPAPSIGGAITPEAPQSASASVPVAPVAPNVLPMWPESLPGYVKPAPNVSAPTTGVRLMSFSEMKTTVEAEPSGWSWDGLLPEAGIVLAVGDPHAGKTTLMAMLCAAATTDDEAGARLGGREVARKRVAFVHLEHQGRPTLEKIEQAFIGAGGAGEPDVRFVTQLSLDNDAEVSELERKLTQEEIDIVVIDCLRRATMRAESISDEAAKVGEALRQLTGHGKRLVIVIHHVGKNGSIRGTNDWRAMADTVLYVSRSGDVVKVRAEHHHAPPATLEMKVQFDAEGRLLYPREGTFATGTESPSVTDRTKVKEAIIKIIRTSAEPPSTTTLRARVREELGQVQNEEVDSAKDELVAEGVIVNAGAKNAHRWSMA